MQTMETSSQLESAMRPVEVEMETVLFWGSKSHWGSKRAQWVSPKILGVHWG